MADLSTPEKAREHARAMAGTVIANMPTVPASMATNLPAGVNPSDVVWDESLGGGEYCARILKRGTRVKITNLHGDGCVSLLLLNADHAVERLSVADTVKIQWNVCLEIAYFASPKHLCELKRFPTTQEACLRFFYASGWNSAGYSLQGSQVPKIAVRYFWKAGRCGLQNSLHKCYLEIFRHILCQF